MKKCPPKTGIYELLILDQWQTFNSLYACEFPWEHIIIVKCRVFRWAYDIRPTSIKPSAVYRELFHENSLDLFIFPPIYLKLKMNSFLAKTESKECEISVKEICNLDLLYVIDICLKTLKACSLIRKPSIKTWGISWLTFIDIYWRYHKTYFYLTIDGVQVSCYHCIISNVFQ